VYRWRWHFWSVYVVLWTTALLFPVIPETGFEDVDEFISPNRYLLAKSVHVSAYAVMTLLTAFLNAPMRYRWLLVYFLMAHGTATEMGQWTMREMQWSVRIGHLHDVAFDNVGVLIGLLLGWNWWMRED
jgi:VanZ family protein